MKKVLVIVLIAIVAVIGVTCALNITDAKPAAAPKLEDAPYLVATQSRIYYIAQTTDLVFNAESNTNTVYRYWHQVKGKWKYSDKALVMPVDTFGPATLRTRTIQ